MKVAPYGTWDSLVSAADIAGKTITFFDTVGDQDYVYNVEMRPNENGRYVIVRYNPDGTRTDVLPDPFSARTMVHEYGGRAFTVHNDTIYFVNFKDQNLYKLKPGSAPVALTNNEDSNHVRFAELNMTVHGLVAVAERHFDAKDSVEAQNYIVLIDPETGAMQTLVEMDDFYAFPTVNKAGTRIAWVSWNHPNMPWDDSELWVADWQDGIIKNHMKIENGSKNQSFYQPQWDAKDDLLFIADLNNWWNLYRWDAKTNQTINICNRKADFAKPLWNLGVLSWGFFKNFLLVTYTEKGETKLALIDQAASQTKTSFIEIPLSYNNVNRICIHKDNLYFVGGAAAKSAELVRCDPDLNFSVLAKSTNVDLSPEACSIAEHIEFPTKSRQGTAYANYYPPTNPDFTAPEGSKPPLIVMIHGGPTSSATSAFGLDKQYWTSRGFAVADVDYGGSTGYGREFRKSLQRDTADEPGYWGDIDVKDCIACVEYLTAQNRIDPTKVVIRGGSAGGYTTLAALATSTVFKAGTSYYGVSDILALAKETHKFESRYMDQLVGELPKYEEIYKSRSPINNLTGFTAPLLVLQGDEDKIVLPNQADMMVNALKQRGIPVEYKLYVGEQHGFRKAETIIDALTRELDFYRSVFNLKNTLEKKVNTKLKIA